MQSIGDWPAQAVWRETRSRVDLNNVACPKDSLMRRLPILVPLLLALASPASAQQDVCTNGSPSDGARIMGRTTGVVGPYTLFDFNGMPLLSGNPVSGMLESGGLQISVSGAFYGPQGSFFYSPFAFPDDGLFNYSNGAFAVPEITLVFNAPTRAVAFNFATDGAASTFKVWKQGVEVTGGSITSIFPGVTSSNLNCWWGFQFTDGTTFDKLTIVGSPYAFGFDNLQVVAATVVPEPGTLALIALGLVGALEARRRSRRVK